MKKGAKILATGSSNNVFHPNIPCKKSNDDITKEKFQKLYLIVLNLINILKENKK